MHKIIKESISPAQIERFYSKIIKTDECWEWNGFTSSHGYGKFWLNKHMIFAHRISYTLEIGDIPEGLELDHLCRNTLCVRPSHLEAVTHTVNMDRMITKGVCKNGHDLSKVPVHVSVKDKVSGRIGRQCALCANARRSKLNQAKREQEGKG